MTSGSRSLPDDASTASARCASTRVGGKPVWVTGVILIYAIFAGLWVAFSYHTLGHLFGEHNEQIALFGLLILPLLLAGVWLLYQHRRFSLLRALHEEQAARIDALQRLALAEFALNHSGECAYLADMTDLAGRFHYVNEAACATLGYRREELLALGVLDVDADTSKEALQAIFADIKSQGNKIFESRHRTKSGRMFPVEINACFFEYEGYPYVLGLVRDITERKSIAEALQESSRRQDAAVKAANIGLWDWDLYTNRVRYSAEWKSQIGYQEHEIGDDFEEWRSRVHPNELAALSEHIRTLITERRIRYQVEYRFRHRNGSYLWILSQGSVITDETGQPVRVLGSNIDITARKQTESRLRLAASVFEHTQEAIAITGADARIVEVNAALIQITGYSREELLGQNPRILKSGHQEPEFYQTMWQSLLDAGLWRGEIWNRRKNGEIYPALLTISAVRDERGQTTHYVGVFSDISALKQHEAALERIAHYDALTGLPNRLLLFDRLRQTIAQSARTKRLLAVCYLDLDGFKQVNDLHGHETGDQLLMEMANRFREQVRGSDTVARLGGDEFVLLLTGLEHESECAPALQRILEAVQRPICAGDHLVGVSASIGISLHPSDDADPDTLLRHADQAMYSAKQEGKNRYFFYDPAKDRSARQRHETVQRLHEALDRREFVLHYQPQVDMRRGRVIGAEALIRWRHPERGLLPPGEFLPLIEDTDLIIAVGDWVIGEALRQIALWQQDNLCISVSINVVARHLQHNSFYARLTEQLAIYPDLPADSLEVEILETAALEDMRHISRLINACRSLTVSFALDDFGTGYSSLTYLKRLPVQTLKIDRSFVCDMLRDPEDLAIVEGVISLSETFNRTVIAEGVETVEHGVLLLHMGCDFAQGYGIARPMPAEQLAAWIRQWRPDPAWAAVGSKRWMREDLPLVMSRSEHCHWVDSVAARFDERQADSPLILDSHQCRFGRWYDGPGRRYEKFPVYRGIGALHEQVHHLSGEALMLKERGQLVEAREKLSILYVRRDELLKALDELMEAIHA